MPKFKYTHTTPTSFQLPGEDEARYLEKDGEYELPGDNAFIKMLMMQGYLKHIKSKKVIAAPAAPETDNHNPNP